MIAAKWGGDRCFAFERKAVRRSGREPASRFKGIVNTQFSGAANAQSARIDESPRDLRLDACRGLALWFIFVDHVPNNIVSWLTLRNYGFSDATEVFVFVSGYTCMVAYGDVLKQQGWLATVIHAVRRSWEQIRRVPSAVDCLFGSCSDRRRRPLP